ncbi:MAG: hypothetical protein EOP10_25370, partial [Proteobacteria bacterium]
MYLVLSGIGTMLSLLSFRALEFLSLLMTVLFFDIFRVRRRLMLKNISIAFHDEYKSCEKIRMARKACQNFIQSMLEAIISRRHAIDADVVVENSQILEDAIALE